MHVYDIKPSASWLELRMPKTVLTSKGNLFPLKLSVLLTYETIISYAYPHCGNILTNRLGIYKYIINKP